MSPAEIKMLLENGGLAAVSMISLFAWFSERKETKKLTQQVVELATAQVAAQTENKALLNSMKELLNQFINRI